jgi:L-fucose isomerase-like protein
MWDWEICSYLKSVGIDTLTPYNQDQANALFQALIAKRSLSKGKFLVFQDNPGEGHQASIFKRFYWWEEVCAQTMEKKFGLNVVKKSYCELASNARLIADTDAERVLESKSTPCHDLSKRALLSATKLTMAIEKELTLLGNVRAAGINCLNESHFSDTTPCLAWNDLFEDRELIWGCEADLLSMLTKYILYESLKVPVMMTNLYPFLMGQAALKHEKISEFPAVESPENYVLVAHCGYMGVIPVSFASEWCLRPKVLSIVDENAHAIDARLPEGKITLVKLDPTLETLSVIRGELVRYVQYPGSHCLNGGIIRIDNGVKLMRNLLSHHYILVTGDRAEDIESIASVFRLDVIRL